VLIILQWYTIVIYTLSYHLKVAITVKNAAYKIYKQRIRFDNKMIKHLYYDTGVSRLSIKIYVNSQKA
jgi:hypothetical protein